MTSELNRRKEAVRLYYYGQMSKAAICRQLKCSRSWLDRWLKRYDPDNVEESLRDRSSAPKQPHTPWSQTIRQQVLAMRQCRQKQPYELIGAEAIHHELVALGAAEVPPVRTIHSWLVKGDLVPQPQEQPSPQESQAIPLPEGEAVNDVHCLDLKGPLYLQGSNQKHYLIALRDSYSRRCAIDVLDSRKAQGIVDFLVVTWRWLGLPRYLQMDNALEFRGPNRYPRSFGQVVRLALDLQVEPVFIPTGEPWRNGLIEWLNGFLDRRLLTVECADQAALRQEAHSCQHVCNEHHRLSVLDGLTPNEVAAEATLSLLPATYQGHQQATLPQDQGFVSFVRLIRKSGRITLGAGDRFMVDPDLAYSYVLARVDLAQQQLVISQADRTIQTYDYSPDTIGQWAADD